MSHPPPPRPSPGAGQPPLTRLYGPEFAQDPHGCYAGLRARWGPIAPVEVGPGVGAWLVLGYQEALTVARDAELFSSDARYWHAAPSGRLPPESPLLPVLGGRPALTRQDGPAHLRLRQAVLDALQRIDRPQLRRLTVTTADELIDAWLPHGQADLVAGYARPVAARAFTRLLGIRDGDGGRLHTLAAAVLDSAPGAAAADRELRAALRQLIETRRTDPGPDLPSWLLDSPAGLTEPELVHQLTASVLAGLESTSGLIGNTLLHLLSRPRLLAALAAGRSTVQDAVELALWAEPPVHNLAARWATTDLTLAGRQLRRGDLLVIALAAANADPAVRPTTDSRPPTVNRAHLAWGAGPHACPARDPARLIAETAVERLVQRVPALQPTVAPSALVWRPSPWARTLTALPVHFPPVTPPPTPEPEPPAPHHGPAEATPQPRTTNWAWWHLDP
ncbi:cytochrome P450 [Kitasatospora sp. NPDC049258]|uniref:cytochrome P450 n=1 Tax=Kitasatospora sp. NPDC049258 TaxID=3155394 RepID=UPI0034172138